MSTCKQAMAARRKFWRDTRYVGRTRKDPLRAAERQAAKVAAEQRRRQRQKSK